jgi:hypothetical protein
MVELGAELVAQLRHRKVADAAGADRSERHAAGLGLGGGHDVRERLVGLRDVGDERHRAGSDQHQWRQVLQRVEGQTRDQRRIDGVRVEYDADRVAVGVGFGENCGADRPGSAAAVIDDK